MRDPWQQEDVTDDNPDLLQITIDLSLCKYNKSIVAVRNNPVLIHGQAQLLQEPLLTHRQDFSPPREAEP